jgi:hypothetical protein
MHIEELHSRVFSGRPIEEGPFARKEWQIALIPGGLGMSERYVKALSNVRGGDTSMPAYLVDAEAQFPEESPIRLDLAAESLRQIKANSAVAHVEAHLFDDTLRWGVAFHPEGVALLGTEPSLLGEFLSHIGGREELVREFAEFAAAGGVGFGDEGARFVEKLMKLAGFA